MRPSCSGVTRAKAGSTGTLDVLFGDEDQGVLPRLAAMLGGLVPAFRGVTTCFYSGLVTSVNPYPKKWEILRRGGNRLWDGNPWYPEKQFIWLADGQIKAMNPAHILYLVYTGRDFRGAGPHKNGRGEAGGAAADTLYAEGFGLCFEWTRVRQLQELLRDGEIAYRRRRSTRIARLGRSASGSCVTTTTLLTCRCSDEDSGLLEITQGEDRLDVASRRASLSSSTSTRSTGRSAKSSSTTMRGRRVAGAAGRPRKSSSWACLPGSWPGEFGEREMRLKTTGLKRYKGVFDRRARSLNPGQPFLIRSTPRGIPETVVRVGRIEDNFLGDGKITLTVVQDQFNLPATTGVAPPPPGLDSARPDASGDHCAPTDRGAISRTGRRDRSGESPAPGRVRILPRCAGRGADKLVAELHLDRPRRQFWRVRGSRNRRLVPDRGYSPPSCRWRPGRTWSR
ncbi:bacteriophage protein [Pseudomonas aeruginosa]|nr:bacteriophage protein [Pseudomonas aeruginosa]